MSRDSDRRLQEQPWYFGLCTRDMIANLLQKKGDFLVRATQKGNKYSLTINIRNDEQVDNFQIAISNRNEYVLRCNAKEKNAKSFSEVMQLIDYYRDHTLPNKMRLRNGIHRPHWLIPPRNVEYAKENIMGSGNFSDVYRGILKRDEREIHCAIKVLHFNNENGLTEDKGRQRFLAEAKMQTCYKHPNVVGMIGVVLDCPPIMMIMEMCPGGSLDKHMRKNGKRISSYEKKLYLLEAAQGMHYLHSQGCIHRDLAARNCLIGSDGKVKISDFGLSLFSPDGETVKMMMKQFPLRWMAPECLREQAFSFKTDVWAFGVLVYEVFSNGSKPFADANTDSEELKAMKMIARAKMPPMPEGTPEEVDALMKEIWQMSAASRPTFVQIVIRFCAALKAEAVPMAMEDLVLSELRSVQLKELPDLEWTEEKEKERMRQQEKEQEDRDKEEKDHKRQEALRRKQRANGTSRPQEGLMASTASTPTARSTKSPLPGNSKAAAVDETKAKRKWIPATLSKLIETHKREQAAGKTKAASPKGAMEGSDRKGSRWAKVGGPQLKATAQLQPSSRGTARSAGMSPGSLRSTAKSPRRPQDGGMPLNEEQKRLLVMKLAESQKNRKTSALLIAKAKKEGDDGGTRMGEGGG